MNKRYDELNSNIQEWFKGESQDVRILQILYSLCNLQHNEMIANAPNLKNGTKFSSLSNEELVALFSKETFNEYSQKDLNHLMQEVHNRYIGENKWDVTRTVYAKADNPQYKGVFGYCCGSNDLLFINKDMIDYAKKIKDHSASINSDTVGKYFLDTVWHETKHIIQYEDGIDFALGKKQDPERAFSAAAMLVMLTDFNIAGCKDDKAYLEKWQSMYSVHFCEHEANYVALKKSKENTDKSIKGNYDYQMYAADSAALALSYEPSTTDMKKNKETIGNRVDKIESYLKSQIEYFNENIENCPIKESIMGILNEYMAEDEKGHSKFRDRMIKEVTEIVDVYVENARLMEKTNKKRNSVCEKQKDIKKELDENSVDLVV